MERCCCARPFCYGEAAHHVEIQVCRDLRVLGQVASSSLRSQEMLRCTNHVSLALHITAHRQP